MFSDAHTHFAGSPLFPDFGGAPLNHTEIQKLLKQARDMDVSLMIVASHDLSSAEQAVQIASAEHDVYAAIGFHPWVASPIDETTYTKFLNLAKRPKVVAISEIGLDKFRSRASKEVQVQVLRQMLRLSEEARRPVMVHDKGYHQELIEILREEKAISGCVHGFEGNVAALKDWLGLDYYISIGRAVLGEDDGTLRAAVQQIPEDKILLETDSAGRSKEGILEGQTRVVQVAKVVAAWLGVSAQVLGENTTRNLRRMLRIESHP